MDHAQFLTCSRVIGRLAFVTALIAFTGAGCHSSDQDRTADDEAAVWSLTEPAEVVKEGGFFEGDSVFFYGIAGAVFSGDNILVAVRGGRDNRLLVLDSSGFS